MSALQFRDLFRSLQFKFLGVLIWSVNLLFSMLTYVVFLRDLLQCRPDDDLGSFWCDIKKNSGGRGWTQGFFEFFITFALSLSMVSVLSFASLIASWIPIKPVQRSRIGLLFDKYLGLKGALNLHRLLLTQFVAIILQILTKLPKAGAAVWVVKVADFNLSALFWLYVTAIVVHSIYPSIWLFTNFHARHEDRVRIATAFINALIAWIYGAGYFFAVGFAGSSSLAFPTPFLLYSGMFLPFTTIFSLGRSIAGAVSNSTRLVVSSATQPQGAASRDQESLHTTRNELRKRHSSLLVYTRKAIFVQLLIMVYTVFTLGLLIGVLFTRCSDRYPFGKHTHLRPCFGTDPTVIRSCSALADVQSNERILDLATSTVVQRNITYIYSDALNRLDQVEVLLLGDNRIEKFDLGTFDGVANLKQLGLEKNNLHGVGLPAGIFSPLTQLELLDLTNNKLYGHIENGAFKGLTKIEQLLLCCQEHPGISALLPNSFDGVGTDEMTIDLGYEYHNVIKYALDFADLLAFTPRLAAAEAQCADDHTGSVQATWGSCAALKDALGCDFDGAELMPDKFARGFNLVWRYCPVTCMRCTSYSDSLTHCAPALGLPDNSKTTSQVIFIDCMLGGYGGANLDRHSFISSYFGANEYLGIQNFTSTSKSPFLNQSWWCSTPKYYGCRMVFPSMFSFHQMWSLEDVLGEGEAEGEDVGGSVEEQGGAHCALLSGHMASIHSEDENSAVYDLWKNKAEMAYIGLMRPVSREVMFGWADGSSMDYSHWTAGYPLGRAWDSVVFQGVMVKSWQNICFCFPDEIFPHYTFGYICRSPPAPPLPSVSVAPPSLPVTSPPPIFPGCGRDVDTLGNIQSSALLDPNVDVTCSYAIQMFKGHQHFFCGSTPPAIMPLADLVLHYLSFPHRPVFNLSEGLSMALPLIHYCSFTCAQHGYYTADCGQIAPPPPPSLLPSCIPQDNPFIGFMNTFIVDCAWFSIIYGHYWYEDDLFKMCKSNSDFNSAHPYFFTVAMRNHQGFMFEFPSAVTGFGGVPRSWAAVQLDTYGTWENKSLLDYKGQDWTTNTVRDLCLTTCANIGVFPPDCPDPNLNSEGEEEEDEE